MSGKHLCQSSLSAAYISSNRYMHIILFYFRLFILFSPGLPFTLTSLVLHPAFLRSSFVLPSSFIRPCSSLPSSFFTFHPAVLLPFHCSLSASSPSFRFSFPSFPFSSPSFPTRPGIPVLSTVLPLVFPTGFSPSFPMFTLSTIHFAPPVIPALVSVIPGSTGNTLPSGASPPCHPERQRRIFPHGFLHNN